MPGWSTSTRRQRLPRNWSRIRRAVLERDGWWCQLRYDCCTGHATQVDHIDAMTDDHTRLQAACGPCHQRKSSREGALARVARRRRPLEPHPGLR